MPQLTNLATKLYTPPVVLELKDSLDIEHVLRLICPGKIPTKSFQEHFEKRIGLTSENERNQNWINYLQCIVDFLETFEANTIEEIASFDQTFTRAILKQFSDLIYNNSPLDQFDKSFEQIANNACKTILVRTFLVYSKKLNCLSASQVRLEIENYQVALAFHLTIKKDSSQKLIDYTFENLVRVYLFLSHPANNINKKFGYAMALLDDSSIKQCTPGFRSRLLTIVNKLYGKDSIDYYLHSIRYNIVQTCSQFCLSSGGKDRVDAAWEVHVRNNFFLHAKEVLDFDVRIDVSTACDSFSSVKLWSENHETELRKAIKTYDFVTIISELLLLLRSEFVEKFNYNGKIERESGDTIIDLIVDTLRNLFGDFKNSLDQSNEFKELFSIKTVFTTKYINSEGDIQDEEPDSLEYWPIIQDINWKNVIGIIVTYFQDLKFIELSNNEKCFLDHFFSEKLSVDILSYCYLPLSVDLFKKQEFMGILKQDPAILTRVSKLHDLYSDTSVSLQEFTTSIQKFWQINFKSTITSQFERVIIYRWLIDGKNDGYLLELLWKNKTAYEPYAPTISENLISLVNTQTFSNLSVTTIQILLCLSRQYHPTQLNSLILELTNCSAEKLISVLDFQSNKLLITHYPRASTFVSYRDCFEVFFPLFKKLPPNKARQFFNFPDNISFSIKKELITTYIKQLNWSQRMGFLAPNFTRKINALDENYPDQSIAEKFKDFFEIISNLESLYFVFLSNNDMLDLIMINSTVDSQIAIYKLISTDKELLLNNPLFMQTFTSSCHNVSSIVINYLIETLLPYASSEQEEQGLSCLSIHNFQILICMTVMRHRELLRPLISKLTTLPSSEIATLLNFTSNERLVKRFPIALDLLAKKDDLFEDFFPLISKLPDELARDLIIGKDRQGHQYLKKNKFTLAYIGHLDWYQRIGFFSPDLMKELQNLDTIFPDIVKRFKNLFQNLNTLVETFYFKRFDSTEEILSFLIQSLCEKNQFALFTLNNNGKFILFDSAYIFMKTFMLASKGVAHNVFEYLIKKNPLRIFRELDNAEHGQFFKELLSANKSLVINLLPSLVQDLMAEPEILQKLLLTFTDTHSIQEILQWKHPNGKSILFALAQYQELPLRAKADYRVIDLLIKLLQQCSNGYQALALLSTESKDSKTLIEYIFEKNIAIIFKLHDLIMKLPDVTQQKYWGYFRRSILTALNYRDFCNNEQLTTQNWDDYFEIAARQFIDVLSSSQLYTSDYSKMRCFLQLDNLILAASEGCGEDKFLKRCLKKLIKIDKQYQIGSELLIGENYKSSLLNHIFTERTDLICVLKRYSPETRLALTTVVLQEINLSAYDPQVILAMVDIVSHNQLFIEIQSDILLRPYRNETSLLVYAIKYDDSLVEIFKNWVIYFPESCKDNLSSQVDSIDEKAFLDKREEFQKALSTKQSSNRYDTNRFFQSSMNSSTTKLQRSQYAHYNF